MADFHLAEAVRNFFDPSSGFMAMATATRARVVNSRVAQTIAGSILITVLTTLANWYVAIPLIQARLDGFNISVQRLELFVKEQNAQNAVALDRLSSNRENNSMRIIEHEMRLQFLEKGTKR